MDGRGAVSHPGPGLPPGTGPGWAADDPGIAVGPLPALKLLAARFSDRLADADWLAFCQATLARGQSLGLDDQRRLLETTRRRNGRDAAVLAALNGFCGAMADAICGNGNHGEEEANS
jgi:hypothetical protein